MQALQSLFKKYWIFVVSKKKKKKKEKEKKKKTYMYTKEHICLGKQEHYNLFFPLALYCTFTLACLVTCWNLWNLKF